LILVATQKSRLFRNKMKETNKAPINSKLVVVLGMHRSGTSAITRGLQVMGVELGTSLFPPIEGNNNKGFWEDIDLNTLNNEILNAINSDWWHVSPIERNDVETLRNKGYFLRAVELLLEKTNELPVFGFKDPRVAKLLPFWKEVFSHCGFEVNYVLAIRHPLSVVKSLAKRDDMESAHSYLLWLGHVIESLIGSNGSKRVLVDYDRHMQSPEKELTRIAECVGLKIDSKKLDSYESGFLDHNLRHTAYNLIELQSDDTAPSIVGDIYTALLEVANSKSTLDDSKLLTQIGHWSTELERLKPTLKLVDRLLMKELESDNIASEHDEKASDLKQSLTERDEQVNDLKQSLTERDEQVNDLKQSLTEYDEQVNDLKQTLTEHDEQVNDLKQTLTEHDEQVNDLKQTLTEHDEQVSDLRLSLTERDEQLSNLKRSMTEAGEKVTNLNQSLTAHDTYYQDSLSDIFNSTSWRLTIPIRIIGTKWKNLKHNKASLFSSIADNEKAKENKRKPEADSSITLATTISKVTKTEALTPPPDKSNKNNPSILKIDFDETCDHQFIKYQKNPPINPAVKLIAFYLPQFHPFPENDEWWGKGFTEWTNVGKANPNYEDHHQPHCPIHFGYYDLRVPEVMEEQAKLAKEYGIYGFSYYFYWFGGKILMDTPLETMLANKKVNMPFCFTWANENWSRRWDGQENDVLMAQNHSDEDSLAFIRHLVKYFKDERYISIEGKPVLIIYRADIIPNMSATSKAWRDELLKHGFPGLYLISAQSFGIRSPDPFNFDASVEFPPHTVISSDISKELKQVNTEFNGSIYSYEQVVANAVLSEEPNYKLFRTATLSWDNTARKGFNSHIFHGFSLLKYKQWLSSIVSRVHSNPKYITDEKIVFINAWNEWAEGTHLEPDQKFGYGYLQTTYDVIRHYEPSLFSKTKKVHTILEKNDIAVILHIHYDELWPEIRDYLLKLYNNHHFDLYLSVTSSSIINKVLDYFPNAHIELVDNRGRDILPFIRMLDAIKDLDYTAVCKIHSKRSVYRSDGDDIRKELLNSLIGTNKQVENVLSKFRNDTKLGLIAPKNYLLEHNDQNMMFNKELVEKIADHIGISFEYDLFPAGTMFWFSPKSLSPLLTLNDSFFEIESGLTDGTSAHAVERMFCQIVKDSNYTIEGC